MVPNDGPFALDLHQSDAHKRADGVHSVRVTGGAILARHASGAIWSTARSVDVALADNATTYIEVSAAGAIVANQGGFTDGAQQLYAIALTSRSISGIQDWRFR